MVAAGVAALLARLALVVVPLAVAVLLAGLLTPPVRMLPATGCRVPRHRPRARAGPGGAAGLATLLAGAVGGALPALVAELTRGLTAVERAAAGLDRGTGDLSVRAVTTTLVPLAQDGLAVLAGDPMPVTAALGTGVVATVLGLAVTVAQVLFGTLLTVFLTAVLLDDGPRVWLFLLRAVPAGYRSDVGARGARAFAALVTHLRSVAATAVLGAVGSGVVLGLLGSPLAGPVAAMVLLGAFVPVVGPLVAGAAAVLVALATAGPAGAALTAAVGIGLSLIAHLVLVPRVLPGAAAAGHGRTRWPSSWPSPQASCWPARSGPSGRPGARRAHRTGTRTVGTRAVGTRAGSGRHTRHGVVGLPPLRRCPRATTMRGCDAWSPVRPATSAGGSRRGSWRRATRCDAWCAPPRR